MDLFSALNLPPENLLPYDGTALYYGPVLSADQAQNYCALLLDTLAWQQDRVKIMGREIITKRKLAWHADQPFAYHYSGVSRTAQPWPAELLPLKQLVETKTQTQFNACLVNLYHSGSEGMGWHSDAETSLQKYAPIASLSLGAQRKFSFKHKHTGETVSLQLAPGSLLVMKDQTQCHWLHSLPASSRVTQARINLTFRIMRAQ